MAVRWVLLLITGGLLLAAGCSRKIVLTGRGTYGWIIIEENRSDCPPAQSTPLNGVILNLDENKYVCTSTQLPDPYRSSYFVRDERGALKSIAGKMIIEESTTVLEGRTFQVAWYGPPGSVPTSDLNEAIRKAIGADNAEKVVK